MMKYFKCNTPARLSDLLTERVYFVSGIDTDAGKSVATGLLSKQLLSEGTKSLTQKMVQTGVTASVAEDIQTHRHIEGRSLLNEDKEGSTCPLVYSYPCSPHMAAARDGKPPIDTALITEATERLKALSDVLLLEGAGGLMVPLTEDLLTMDYVKVQKLPVILVSTAKLGSINHTLLSLDALKHRDISVPLLIYNRHVRTDDEITEESFRWLSQYLTRHYPNTLLLEMESIVL
ncbi:MAG: dethiobiotin synthase [Porphyromonas sp.]|nr:dethiobiotin synthase [Porphyromonas sp.]